MDDSYDRFKIFIYKEDLNKFLETLTETINHIKTELMPNFDFDAFNRPPQEHHYDQPSNYLPQEDKTPTTSDSPINTVEDSGSTDDPSNPPPEAPPASGDDDLKW